MYITHEIITIFTEYLASAGLLRVLQPVRDGRVVAACTPSDK